MSISDKGLFRLPSSLHVMTFLWKFLCASIVHITLLTRLYIRKPNQLPSSPTTNPSPYDRPSNILHTILKKPQPKPHKHINTTTVHHCPKSSKGNCRKGVGTDGKPICTKHQKNCKNITRTGKVCNYPRIIEERCKGPCSR